MKNLFLDDGQADARVAGRASDVRLRDTGRSCAFRRGDVVFHGETLIAVAGALPDERLAAYRRDGVLVEPEHSWQWVRDVLLARHCPERCARLFSEVLDVRQGDGVQLVTLGPLLTRENALALGDQRGDPPNMNPVPTFRADVQP